MDINSIYNVIWSEDFWFPAKNNNYTWNDFANKPGSNIYYPDIKPLILSFFLGFVLLVVRYLFERYFAVPLAAKFGIPDGKLPKVTPNETLEKVYKGRNRLDKNTLKILSKQTDFTVRQIEIWLRRRKTLDSPTAIQKFRECSWHLLFYTILFVYGLVYLWQHVTNDMYWHYMLELGFYWSLVFTLFSDNKRKDFMEMIIHHFSTIVLMYSSWMSNIVRIGTLVLVVHDAADTWLALAKMSNYAKRTTATEVFFGIFMVVWVVTRLLIYPFFVIYSVHVEMYTVTRDTYGVQFLLLSFLYLLQLLHIIWTYMIFRILYRKLVKGTAEDVRSDSEDSGKESDKENVAAVRGQHNKYNTYITENGNLSNSVHVTTCDTNGNVTRNGK